MNLDKKRVEMFKDLFPHAAFKVTSWWRKGPNTVRIRTKERGDFYFTYDYATGEWKIESPMYFELSKDGI